VGGVPCTSAQTTKKGLAFEKKPLSGKQRCARAVRSGEHEDTPDSDPGKACAGEERGGLKKQALQHVIATGPGARRKAMRKRVAKK